MSAQCNRHEMRETLNAAPQGQTLTAGLGRPELADLLGRLGDDDGMAITIARAAP